MTYDDFVGLTLNIAMAAGVEARGACEGIRAAFGEAPAAAFFDAASLDASEAAARAIEWRAANQVARGPRG